jgi:hypothetical protein
MQPSEKERFPEAEGEISLLAADAAPKLRKRENTEAYPGNDAYKRL